MSADVWSTPFETLRAKWSVVPMTRERMDSRDLLALSDDELLRTWQESYDADGALGRRGWYRLLYSDFMRGKKVLDIGCGFGYDGLGFAQSGAASVTFADIVASNLEAVAKVARLRGTDNVDFHFVHDIESLARLPDDYDVVTAIGSLHNAPQHVMKPEMLELARRLKAGGRWLQLAYPKVRWEREGSLPFDEWGPNVDGPGTPWEEWYDVPKLLDTLSPARFELVFYIYTGAA